MIGLAAFFLAALSCIVPDAAPAVAQEAALPADDPNPNIRLMRAIWRQDHDAVTAALKSGATPNYIAPFSEFKTHFGGNGWADHANRLISALGLAARLTDLASMDLIVSAGADLNLHARAQDTNLPATNRTATVSFGETSSLDMTKRLIGRGYRPTVQDITSALDLRRTIGWEEWSTVILSVPTVPMKVAAIRAGTDPDYQKFIAEQDADRAEMHEKSDGRGLDLQIHTAQGPDQDTLGLPQEVTGGAVGEMVCSKPGIYRTKYVGWIEQREQDRVLLKIAGGFNGKVNDFRPGEMRWDDIGHWTPCVVH
jgi:hypothetical protein